MSAITSSARSLTWGAYHRRPRAKRVPAARACRMRDAERPANSEMVARDIGPRARGLELEVALPMNARAGLVGERFVRHGEVEVGVGEPRIGFDRLLEVGDGA